jgi:hypothetical protein
MVSQEDAGGASEGRGPFHYASLIRHVERMTMWEDPLPPPSRVITSTEQLEEEFAEDDLIPGKRFKEVLLDGDDLKALPEYDLPPADDKANKEGYKYEEVNGDQETTRVAEIYRNSQKILHEEYQEEEFNEVVRNVHR